MPPPTTNTQSVSSRVDNIIVPSADLEHALDRTTGPSRQGRVDGDFVLQPLQRVTDVGKGDPLHVRAQIAGPQEVDVWILQRDVVAHRALGHEHDAGGPPGITSGKAGLSALTSAGGVQAGCTYLPFTWALPCHCLPGRPTATV